MAILPGLCQGKEIWGKMTAEAKYNRELTSGQIVLEDVEEALKSREKEEIEVAYERICELINKLEISKDKCTEEMLGEEKTIDQVREWNKEQKGKDQSISKHKEKAERTTRWFQTERNRTEERRRTVAPTATDGRTSNDR